MYITIVWKSAHERTRISTLISTPTSNVSFKRKVGIKYFRFVSFFEISKLYTRSEHLQSSRDSFQTSFRNQHEVPFTHLFYSKLTQTNHCVGKPVV